ncbi:hypothetical protein FHX82_005451 [Amycolatopsis bartoniae]|uniref:C-deglycosylation enzyme beta subunit n=1 Tax=Amycolatopsis bartoniae TaxID=941986 RepID=A0A8H9M7M1_9PSEU|nr:DUF6379 domain-containing protein [Amycolatopsis bartoniae]MBB2938375.1 hypothetical protein [Amycolatopsis bartoniae]TVT10221.1 flagellar biosynthesis protein [Amycolatopsis bartoniae]GHF34726.1 hypothetical protein GCM10017566_04290 [Amycolatopsis bartoniae]
MFPERLIEAGTVRPTAKGFCAGLRLTWYRALPLSCIERITVTVDGTEVPDDAISLSVAATGPLSVPDMASLTDTWWYVLDSALLTVDSAVAAAPGEHEVTVVLGLYIPYLPVDGSPLVNLDTCSARLKVAA